MRNMVCVLFFTIDSNFCLYVHTFFFFYVKIVYFYIFPRFCFIWCCHHLWSSISPDGVNTRLLFLKGQKLCKGRNVVVWPRTIDMFGLDSSEVEHLSIYAWVPGSNSRSSHTFSLIYYVFFIVYSSIPPIPTTVLF